LPATVVPQKFLLAGTEADCSDTKRTDGGSREGSPGDRSGVKHTLHFSTDDSIATFQQTIRELFLGAENREMTKRYLKLFIDKIIINLPKVEIVGKTEAVLAKLEKKQSWEQT